MYLNVTRKKKLAFSEAERARELDPVSSVANQLLGYAYFSAGQYDKAIWQARIASELSPVSPSPWLLSASYRAKGMREQGFSEWLEELRLDGDGKLADELKRVAAETPSDEARPVLVKETVGYLVEKAKHQYVSSLYIARVYAESGDRAHALLWLDKAYAVHEPTLPWINTDPAFDEFRSDPRFRTLVQKVGLPN